MVGIGVGPMCSILFWSVKQCLSFGDSGGRPRYIMMDIELPILALTLGEVQY